MTQDTPMNILILHGPNLNLFGRREPHIYGSTTLAQINERLQALAAELGVNLEILQSNHEGELLDWIHAARGAYAGVVINPAAWTHPSVALRDALVASELPVIEVHLSNIAAREPWRSHSIISPAVRGTVQGLGWRSYMAGLRTLVELLRDTEGR